MSTLRIFKDFTFCASHNVLSLPEGHKCRNIHGHNYRVRVWVSGTIDMPTGMCAGVQFDQIKEAWKELEPVLDHQNLNALLGGNATTEHLAIYLYAQFQRFVPWVSRVTVWESDTCGAEFGE